MVTGKEISLLAKTPNFFQNTRKGEAMLFVDSETGKTAKLCRQCGSKVLFEEMEVVPHGFKECIKHHWVYIEDDDLQWLKNTIDMREHPEKYRL